MVPDWEIQWYTELFLQAASWFLIHGLDCRVTWYGVVNSWWYSEDIILFVILAALCANKNGHAPLRPDLMNTDILIFL